MAGKRSNKRSWKESKFVYYRDQYSMPRIYWHTIKCLSLITDYYLVQYELDGVLDIKESYQLTFNRESQRLDDNFAVGELATWKDNEEYDAKILEINGMIKM